MGLFEKKYCDICGEKITFLGNRKLEDGNMCTKCAKLISPFFSGRRKTTVEEMKKHLGYRKENLNNVRLFNASETLGEMRKLYIDSSHGWFTLPLSEPSSWEKENPDIIPVNEVSSCNLEIKEHRTEEFTKDSSGNIISYSPPRYKYKYDFHMFIHLTSPWFSEITWKLNTWEVEGLNSQKYHNYELLAQTIINRLTGNQSEISAGRGYGAFSDFGVCTTISATEALGRAFVSSVEKNAASANNASPDECIIPPDFDPIAEMEKSKIKALEEMQTKGIPEETVGKKICPNCNNISESKFCPECGTKMLNPIKLICSGCGYNVEMKGKIPKFCPECGHKFTTDDLNFN